MKKVFTTIAVLIAMFISLQAADVTVTDDGSGVGTTTWTSDNVYILDGLVFVNDGQVLTIEAGTVVKGKPGQEENASALIVARGGKLIAEGTASAPIIFTAEADDLAGSVDEKARGLWGGVILLGKGINNNPTDEKAIEGIPTSETRGLYGAATTVEDDMSASMKYVSIRHGGTDIGEGNEINGLTLGACGSGTTVSHLEVLSNKDDGVEFFGGSPRLDHILVAYCADDSYDYDEGYSGYGQFWVVLQDPLAGDRMGEHDGGPSSNQLGTPYAHPIISNATYIGRGTGAGKRVITFRDNAGGEYHNSIFVNQEKGIDIEFRGNDGGSYDRFAEGNLVLANNIFNSVADGTDAGIFKVVSELDDNDDPIYNVTQTERDAFANAFADNGNMVADPQVTLAHPTPKGDVGNPVYPSGLDSWFSKVGYKGAFEPDENWAANWSASLGDFTPDPRPEGEVIVQDDGSGIGGTAVTWTSNNTYILDGLVFVNDGQTLTIEGGTVIKGKPGQEENASALVVARGGKIIATGSENNPIIFTAEADDLQGSVDEKARGLWGGVILLGKGTNNNNTTDKAIEGIPTSESRGLYGGNVEDDESGTLKYVSIRHGGTDIGEGNEINGLTLGSCGTGTDISYVEVVSNKDDGVEWFGGAPRLHHILVAWCADDSYDYDEGYRGYNQFMCAIQDPIAGDRLGEHDGGPSSNQLGQPYAHPIFSNATYVGRGSGAGKNTITFRDNAGGEYHNSVFASQEKGIDIEFRGADGGSYDRFDEGNLVLANNIFYDIADGSAEGIFQVVSEKDDNDDPIYNVTQTELDAFAAAFDANSNDASIDPVVTADNPTIGGDFRGADFNNLPEWFTLVDYKGAFEPNENWAQGWTLSLGDVNARNNPFVSTRELAAEDAVLNVYPNPMTESATVEFDNFEGNAYTFTMFDMSGRAVKVINNIRNSRFTVERDGLKSGLYLYRMTGENGRRLDGKLFVQ